MVLCHMGVLKRVRQVLSTEGIGCYFLYQERFSSVTELSAAFGTQQACRFCLSGTVRYSKGRIDIPARCTVTQQHREVDARGSSRIKVGLTHIDMQVCQAPSLYSLGNFA